MQRLVNYSNKDWILIPELNEISEIENILNYNFNLVEDLFQDLIIYDKYSNKLYSILNMNDLKFYKYSYKEKKLLSIN